MLRFRVGAEQDAGAVSHAGAGGDPVVQDMVGFSQIEKGVDIRYKMVPYADFLAGVPRTPQQPDIFLAERQQVEPRFTLDVFEKWPDVRVPCGRDSFHARLRRPEIPQLVRRAKQSQRPLLRLLIQAAGELIERIGHAPDELCGQLPLAQPFFRALERFFEPHGKSFSSRRVCGQQNRQPSIRFSSKFINFAST